MFKGTFRYRMDAKGRLPLPPAFRKQLALQGGPLSVVLTLVDQCIAVYPQEEWSRLETQLTALPAFDKQTKALTRVLASHAEECVLDIQGRILLPSDLRRAVSLERDVVMIGALNRLEIWSPATWAGFLSEAETLLNNASFDFSWPLPPSSTRKV
ncbi:MAG: division/cell wall cluster transcriptional repressor MraZ [Vicinamibacteria bacterium]|nr:division/cell wall cluster transcriptional repressor MraZ [Vicinamibacteria bacterium]